MALKPSTPVTGSPQSGFTTPTYTLYDDRPPNNHTGIQVAIAALGGTQAGVRANSVSDPFTLTIERPANFSTLQGLQSGLTGLYGKVGENTYRWRTRKGVNIAASNLPRLMTIETIVRIPAGADSYDAPNVRAALSLHIGSLWETSAYAGDLLVLGNMP